MCHITFVVIVVIVLRQSVEENAYTVCRGGVDGASDQ